jgi:formylglycine-generating enzyme required for sulfatase activity
MRCEWILAATLSTVFLGGCFESGATNGEESERSSPDARSKLDAAPPEETTPDKPQSAALVCGAGKAELCTLGGSCTSDADCASSICAESGPRKSTCVGARSCTGGKGADDKCGANGKDDCCASPLVTGGRFQNPHDGEVAQTVTVSSFHLDTYELTVGRLRAFFDAKGGNLRAAPPKAGDGAHPHVAKSGWRASWNVRLPAGYDEINDRLGPACAAGGDANAGGTPTWTPKPGANEDKPVTCIDWYTLFAFCAWDGGRLATDAEWSYAAQNGAASRYVWGDEEPFFDAYKTVLASRLPTEPGDAFGLFTEGPEEWSLTDNLLHIAHVGHKSERSKFGQADLMGNVLEWVLDAAKWKGGAVENDHADVSWPDPPQAPIVAYPLDWQVGAPAEGDAEFSDAKAVLDGKRFARGSSWQGEEQEHWLPNGKNRFYGPVWRTYGAIGGRCARDLVK